MPLLWTINQTVSTNEIDFTPSFTANGLLISVEANNTESLLLKVGYLQISVVVDGELYDYSLKLIKLGKSILSVPLKSYRLSFLPTEFQSQNSSFTLKIAPYNLTEIMGINFAATNRETGSIIDTVVTVTTTSASLLGPDGSRHEGSIYNRTNKNIYITWGTTPATSNNGLIVPPGSNLDIPEDYTGAIQVSGAIGVTGTVLAQTISFI